MPNWCYNYVKFAGDNEGIQKLKSIVENNDDEANMFEKLIGRDPGISDEEFEMGSRWRDHNIQRYGTKWDVTKGGFSFPEGRMAIWSDDTAWSPPIEFWRRCSEVYNLRVKMYYEEPGLDFCGECALNNGKIIREEEYTYDHGIYQFRGYRAWYDRAWDYSGRENLRTSLEIDGKTPSRENILERLGEWYGFLKEEEIQRVADDAMRAYSMTQ